MPRLALRGSVVPLVTGCAVALLLASCSRHPSTSQTAATSTRHPAKPGVTRVQSQAQGVGKTFDEALQDALVLAVSKINGERVAKSIDMKSMLMDYHAHSSTAGHYNEHSSGEFGMAGHANSQSSSISASTSSAASGTFSGGASVSGSFSNQQTAVDVSSQTGGAVRSFQVDGSHQSNGLWFVDVTAEVPTYRASEASHRLTIAVLPFRVSHDDAATDTFSNAIRSTLVSDLARSNKIAVLDRDYSAEELSELARDTSANFSPNASARAGHLLGADYIIVGTIGPAGVSRDSMKLVGMDRTIYGATHAYGAVNFRVIETATGVVQASGSATEEGYPSETLNDLAKAEAEAIAERTIRSLFPLRIEAYQGGVLYLDEGGNEVHVGDRLAVFQQGQPIIDADTHQAVGHTETPVGTISVFYVGSRLAQARWTQKSRKTFQVADLIARPLPDNPSTIHRSKAETKSAKRPVVTKPMVKQGVDY